MRRRVPAHRPCRAPLLPRVLNRASAPPLHLPPTDECATAGACAHTCSAGVKYEFLWAENGGPPRALPALQYFGLVFDTAERVLEGLAAADFLPDTPALASALAPAWRRLLRVFSHVAAHHWAEVERAGAAAHVTSAVRHAVRVARAHGGTLVAEGELEPLLALLGEGTA